MKDYKVKINSSSEIEITIPNDVDEEELVIDLEELGVDLDKLDDEVNVVVQFEGDVENDIDEDGEQPNEWYFDDDPYGIVYYEFMDN